MLITEYPQIAIVTPNTLTALGLRTILEKMMPGAEALLFSNVEDLVRTDEGQYYHYFISADVLMDHSHYFLERHHKTIVLVYGNEETLFPKQFHTFNVCLNEEQLVRSVLKLAEMAHGAKHPMVVEKAKETPNPVKLTPREREVLRLIVLGKKNREIATQLNVTLATIITHRKNFIEKLRIKSVSGLTIYAVTHGIVRAEEI